MKILRPYLPLAFVFILLCLSWKLKLLIQKPTITISKEVSAFNLDSRFLSIFSFGQKRLYSDLIWISTLLESDLEHFKNKKKDSWMFLRFKTISDLDPLFLKNYQFGGQYLSIIKDDISGAEKLMTKGLSFYRDDYILNFNLGYLLAIETDNYQRSIPYLERVLNNPKAPKNLKTLLTKIKYMASGDLNATYLLLKSFLETITEKTLIDKIKVDLYSVKAEIDLSCLNSSINQVCDTHDYKGLPYILKDGVYVTQVPFIKYKIHKKTKKGL
jgi:hypothetical protein